VAQQQLRGLRWRPPCQNVQSTEAEARPRHPESARVVQHPAILATPMMAVERPRKHSPPLDFPVFERLPRATAAAQLHWPIPDCVACGRSPLRAHRQAAPRCRPAAIPPVPWCVRSRREEAPQQSSVHSTAHCCELWPRAEPTAWWDRLPGSERVDLLPTSDPEAQPTSASHDFRLPPAWLSRARPKLCLFPSHDFAGEPEPCAVVCRPSTPSSKWIPMSGMPGSRAA